MVEINFFFSIFIYGWAAGTKILKKSVRRKQAPYIACDHKNIRMTKEDINNAMNRPRKSRKIPSQVQIGSSKLLEDLQFMSIYVIPHKHQKGSQIGAFLPLFARATTMPTS